MVFFSPLFLLKVYGFFLFKIFFPFTLKLALGVLYICFDILLNCMKLGINGFKFFNSKRKVFWGLLVLYVEIFKQNMSEYNKEWVSRILLCFPLKLNNLFDFSFSLLEVCCVYAYMKEQTPNLNQRM